MAACRETRNQAWNHSFRSNFGCNLSPADTETVAKTLGNSKRGCSEHCIKPQKVLPDVRKVQGTPLKLDRLVR